MRKIRIKEGQALAEIYPRLTLRQWDALNAVVAAERKRIELSHAQSAQQAQVHKEVHDALRAGVPAALLAEQFQVTVSRIYQMSRLIEAG